MSTPAPETTIETETATVASVAQTLSSLIRFDTTNPGREERPAAEWVAERLTSAGLSPQVLESAPGRTSVVARLGGTDTSRPALLVHAHLDVVPADPSAWQVHPFSGEIREDGCVWGRGAVDMKDFIAMVLTVLDLWHQQGVRARRDIVFAFTADEEAGGAMGARFLVDRRPDVLEGCDEAIGEVGGFSVSLPEGTRIYPIQTAEKGSLWLALHAEGTPGHGSLATPENAVTRLSAALARIGAHRPEPDPGPQTALLLGALAEERGLPPETADATDTRAMERLLSGLGGFGRLLDAVTRDVLTPTTCHAGDKVNTVPARATGTVDARFLPGHRETLLDTVDDLLGPDVRREILLDQPAVDSPWNVPLVEGMVAALKAEDPAGRPVPFVLSGGTDAKSFSRLGIRCYGFSPLRLPPAHDFVALFHGVDERVPIAALEFGVRVLDRFLRSC